MKVWSVVGLPQPHALLAVIPVSPQVTQRGGSRKEKADESTMTDDE